MRVFLAILVSSWLCCAACLAQPSPYPCESEAIFVEPGTIEAQQYRDYRPKAWQEWQKRRVDYALDLVKSVAPGLVTNACLGGKVRLVNCGRPSNDLLQSYLSEIYFYPKFWSGITSITPWKLADMLAHELTHTVDNGNDLSRSSDWKVYTHDRVMECRKLLAKQKHTSGFAKDLIAQQCGLPSAYCVKAPPESLAESVSALLFNKQFHLPLDMQEFVQQRVLDVQPYTNYNQLMHEGWNAELNRNFPRAAAVYTQALRLDPLSVRAQQGLASCLMHLGKKGEAEERLTILEAQLRKESDLCCDHAELHGVHQLLSRLKGAPKPGRETKAPPP